MIRALILLAIALITACKRPGTKEQTKFLPSKEYRFVSPDSASLAYKGTVYAPVYSHTYGENGNRQLSMTATLSIRNISFTDSFFVTAVVYYGSQGEVLKHYIDKPLVLRPMASVEFVVERSESEGGAGANFIVQWAAQKTPANEPLIQTLMSETTSGVSFIAPSTPVR